MRLNRARRRVPAGLMVRLLVTTLLAVTLSGCGSRPAAQSRHPADGAQEVLSGRVVVLAAASLTETFTELKHRFETAHPGVEVVLSFGGSSALAQQVASGAPADLFASASTATMATAVEAGDVGDPVVFARNHLQIAVPHGNPGHVRGLADLADTRRTVALCAPQVPCGAASKQLFAVAGLKPAPDTLEQDVKAVLTKVELGEVDAGLVYRTDVIAAADGVEGVAVPQASAVVNDYPVAILTDAQNHSAATAFVGLLTSPEGRSVLTGAGFDVP